MVQKSLIYTIVIILIILVFAIILFYNYSSSVKAIRSTTSIVTTTKPLNISNSTLRNEFGVYSENMNQTKNIEIRYVVNTYKLAGITEYGAAFIRNLTLYKYNGSSSISLDLFTPYNKSYSYSNLTAGIFCNAAAPFYNFTCKTSFNNPAAKAYFYIESLYHPNGSISYNGTNLIADLQCNKYNLYYPNGSLYAYACIDPKSGYPLSVNIPSLNFSIQAVGVLSNTSSSGLAPSYLFGLNRIMCGNVGIAFNILAFNITAFSTMQKYPILIYAYPLKNSSNLPLLTAYTFISNLTAGNSIRMAVNVRWQKPISGPMLIKLCNTGGFCESSITPC